jgi:hypothetical protein
MLAMLAVAAFAFAAAGATLDDPAGSMRVGIVIGIYTVLNLAIFVAMALVPSRKWPWILGASLVTLALIALTSAH